MSKRKRDKEPEDRGRGEESIAGMGGGIAGPAEPGAAGTAGGGTAVGGELATNPERRPSSAGGKPAARRS